VRPPLRSGGKGADSGRVDRPAGPSRGDATGASALETVSRRLLAVLGRISGLESTYVTMVDWARDTQEILFARNTGGLDIPEGLRVTWSDTLCRRALDGGPACTDDVPGVYPDSDAARELGLQTYVTVPIRDGQGATFGTLCGASARRVAISDDVRLVMETLSEMIGGTVERETDRRRLAEANARLERADEEHRRQQEALVASEQTLRLVQDGAATGIAVLEIDGRWQQVNPALCEILGRAAAELLTLTFSDVALAEDIDREPLGRLLAGQITGFQAEGRCVRPDGTMIWTQIHVSLLPTGDGEQPRLIIQVVDIDARRRHDEVLAREVAERQHAEQVARRERDFLAVVLGSMREGYVYSVGGTIVDVNETLCRLTGFSRDDLIGHQPPYPFWASAAVASHTDAIAAVRDAGGGDLELDFVRKDGTSFPAAITARPALTGTGSAEGYITIVNDLTAVKDRERHLLDIASRDGLTGLFNRRAIEQRMAAVEPGDAVVILDLDHFKDVNDTAGHAAGDLTITNLAACITGTLRDGDWAGRLGGEEFVVVLRAVGAAAATAVIDRLRAAWQATDPLTTFSAGVAVHRDGDEARQTFARADEALYRAKHNGRNRTEAVADDSAEPVSAEPT
jgi:diguanylate cyclase (GGDEF)-like protein/PAS domain S-box-containing protein